MFRLTSSTTSVMIRNIRHICNFVYTGRICLIPNFTPKNNKKRPKISLKLQNMHLSAFNLEKFVTNMKWKWGFSFYNRQNMKLVFDIEWEKDITLNGHFIKQTTRKGRVGFLSWKWAFSDWLSAESEKI